MQQNTQEHGKGPQGVEIVVANGRQGRAQRNDFGVRFAARGMIFGHVPGACLLVLEAVKELRCSANL